MPSNSFTEYFATPRDISQNGLVLIDVSNVTTSKVQPIPFSNYNKKAIELFLQQHLKEQEEALVETEIDTVKNIS